LLPFVGGMISDIDFNADILGVKAELLGKKDMNNIVAKLLGRF